LEDDGVGRVLIEEGKCKIDRVYEDIGKSFAAVCTEFYIDMSHLQFLLSIRKHRLFSAILPKS
jgi:hypothetical protein